MGIDELIANAEQLPLEEQLRLVMKLLERIRQNYALADKPCPRWGDICGAAPYPLVGEDAQTWVSKTRSESDAHRERNLH